MERTGEPEVVRASLAIPSTVTLEMPTSSRITSIAIVDDDEPFRAALANFLRSCGYDILGFESAEAYLNRDHVERVDLLITDIVMPGMNGLELLTVVRNERAGLPVIVVTASGDPRTCRAAIERGALACLQKPFDSAALFSLVEAATAH